MRFFLRLDQHYYVYLFDCFQGSPQFADHGRGKGDHEWTRINYFLTLSSIHMVLEIVYFLKKCFR